MGVARPRPTRAAEGAKQARSQTTSVNIPFEYYLIYISNGQTHL